MAGVSPSNQCSIISKGFTNVYSVPLLTLYVQLNYFAIYCYMRGYLLLLIWLVLGLILFVWGGGVRCHNLGLFAVSGLVLTEQIVVVPSLF